MKKMPRLICALFILGWLSLMHCPLESSPSPIYWWTHYESAVNQARIQGKPLLLFFTGTGWCQFCTRLEQEVFDTPVFSEMCGQKYIFIKLDFPQDKNLIDGATLAQNRRLLNQFSVKTFPNVILLEPNSLREIGRSGYRPGGAKAYGSHLNYLIETYGQYQQKIGQMHRENLSAAALKELCLNCKMFNEEEELEAVLRAGEKSTSPEFFLLERYQQFARTGLLHQKESIAIKHLLLASQREETPSYHRAIAMMEFEALSRSEGDLSVEHRVAPLKGYLQRQAPYLEQANQEKAWVHTLMAQAYLQQHHFSAALHEFSEAQQLLSAVDKEEISVMIERITSLHHHLELSSQQGELAASRV